MSDTSHILRKKLALKFTLILCFLGYGILSFIGYKIDNEESSLLTKIHPVSYFLIAISFLNLFRIKEIRKMVYFYAFNKYEYRLMILILFIFIYLYLTNNFSAVSFIIDTLLCPVLILLNFKYMPDRIKWDVMKLGIQLILLNSYIAIIERVVTINIFPISTGYGELFRSTALLGHPLNNALITLVFFLYVLSISIQIKRKLYIITVLFIALICFGARGSLYVSLLALLLLFIVPVFISKRPEYRRLNKANIIVFVSLMMGLLTYLTLFTVLGERLVNASFYDSSAEIRTKALDIIDIDNISNYLLATSQESINKMAYYADIEIIENFFIIWILKFGLIIAGLLLAFLYQLLYVRMFLKGFFNKNLIVLLFLMAAATNNSLGTNTQTLSIFVLLFCLYSKSENMKKMKRNKMNLLTPKSWLV